MPYSILESKPRILQALTQQWRSIGATELSIWLEDRLIYRSQPVSDVTQPGLIAPIKFGNRVIGELRVCGLNDAEANMRLQTDALLLAGILNTEQEIEDVTTELVSAQDQLLALYDLTRLTHRRLSLHGVLDALVLEAARLVETEGGLSWFAPDSGESHLIQQPQPALTPAAIQGLFEQARQVQLTWLLSRTQIEELGAHVRNLLLLPIQVRGQVTMMLGLWNKKADDFSSPDLKLARAVADHIGVQVENTLLYQEVLHQTQLRTEFDLAAQIQTQLLPHRFPKIDGLDVFAATRPAIQVGGDFFDFIYKPDRPFTFTVGDVSGKGLSAAMVMAMTRTALRSKASFVSMATPEIILSRSNEDLYDDFTEVGKFATVFVGQYTPQTRELTYANAGHAPVLFCPAGESACLLEADGAPIGVLPISQSRNQSVLFRRGDVLVVATDGFSEASNATGDLFGYERLIDLVTQTASHSAEELVNALFTATTSFSAAHPQDDDQTILVIKRTD